MDKIKENLLSTLKKIRSQIFANPLSSARLRLSVAENIFIFSAFLYFLLTLMAVSGFFPYFASALVFFLYPIFTLSILVLVWAIINYFLTVYLERFLFFRYILFALLTVAYGAVILHHIGIY